MSQRIYSFTLLLVRVTIGVVMGAHGLQKMFGWFDGYGFDGTMHFFTDTIGLPYIAGVTIIVLETVGMIALIAGLFSRMMSCAVILIMAGTIFTVHASAGFFMNWGGNLSGEGYEYHLLMIALASVIALNGAGAFSLDEFIFQRNRSHPIQHHNA